MGYRTIVAGTDGSDTAAVALRSAARLAHACDAELVVATVAQPPNYPEELANDVLQYTTDLLRQDGVEPRTEVLSGDAADQAIVGLAERRDADLIVVGNVGMGRATRIRLGGVPDRIAHSAPCDLLIVDTDSKFEGGQQSSAHPEAPTDATAPGPDKKPSHRASRLYNRIVIGTDGSPTATEAARKGFELAEIVRSDVTLVYVGDPIVGSIVLEQTAKDRPGRAKVQTRVETGDPAAEIIGVAKSDGADLVVVGNKGMTGTRRLLGSVPNDVAHAAPTDVLIVKTVGRSIEDLAPGTGGVVDSNGDKVAAYRDEDGKVTAVSPRCTHMGCTVDWNAGDKTWDCPCHGSRFGVDGSVLRGPARRALPRVEMKGS